MSHFNTQALVFTAFHQTMFKNFGKKHGQIKPSTPWFGMQNHEYLKPPGYSLVLPEFGIGPEPDRTRTLKGPSHNILWMDTILHQLVTIGIPTKHCKELGCNGILPIYKLVQDFFPPRVCPDFQPFHGWNLSKVSSSEICGGRTFHRNRNLQLRNATKWSRDVKG